MAVDVVVTVVDSAIIASAVTSGGKTTPVGVVYVIEVRPKMQAALKTGLQAAAMFVGEAVGRESAAMNDATAEQARSLERAVRSVYNLDPGLGY